MKLTKQQRQALKEKYNGRCAYCGDLLEDRWHADHIEPIVRNWGNGTCEHPERNTLENFNPSCPSSKLYSFLEGNSININLSGLKEIMNDIKRFTEENPKLEKIKKRRDTVAHVFKANRSVRVANDNSVNFKDHLLIILKARELLQNLYKYLFDQKFENIDIDVNLFLKVYEKGVQSLNNIND